MNLATFAVEEESCMSRENLWPFLRDPGLFQGKSLHLRVFQVHLFWPVDLYDLPSAPKELAA